MLKYIALFVSIGTMMISAINGELCLSIANGFLVLISALNLMFE